jgi:hypothetical protein
MRKSLRCLAFVGVLLCSAHALSAQTVTKSFTAVGDGPDLLVNTGDTVTYSQSGTFVGTTVLQQIIAGGATPIVTATGASSGSFIAQAKGNDAKARYRYRATAYTSGTIVTSLIGTPRLGTGAGTPGGSTTQVQFNNDGSFGGSTGLTWDGSKLTAGVAATAYSAYPAIVRAFSAPAGGASQYGILSVVDSDSTAAGTALYSAMLHHGTGDVNAFAQDLITTGSANSAATAMMYLFREHDSTGTIDRNYSIYIDDLFMGVGAGAIFVNYGLYESAQTGATHNYYTWFGSRGTAVCKEDAFAGVGQAVCREYSPFVTQYSAGLADFHRTVYGQFASISIAESGTEAGGTLASTLPDYRLKGADIRLSPAATGFVFLHERVGTAAPAAGDCDAAGETNRVLYDATADNLYVCSGASGWRKIATAAP